MKERPILLNGPMVRAILDGSKTQTRRIVKQQPVLEGALWRLGGAGWSIGMSSVPVMPYHSLAARSPYGMPRDHLWVREAWRTTGDGGRADYLAPRNLQPSEVWHEADGAAESELCVGKLRPSMFMPRWASRITLEVTGVRMERLQAISEADAEAEGIDFLRRVPDADETLTASQLFMCLWDSVAAPGADWAANPWVWVIEFKRIEA